MKNVSILTVLFVIFFSLRCQKDAVLSTKDYPYVLTHEIVFSDSTGTTLKGEILGSSKETVIEYGFVWSTGQTPTLNNFKYTFYENDFIGIFEKHITFDFIKNTHYKVRAYAKTKSLTIYGNIISFTSQGSSQPVIEDFFPKVVTDGDLLNITGKNFSSNPNGIKVLIGTLNTIIDSSSNKNLKIKIPSKLSAGSYKIVLQTSGNIAFSEEDIVISNPIIESFSPEEGLEGTQVEIVGKFFSQDSVNITVRFGRNVAKIIKSKKDNITVTVPKIEEPGQVKITINVTGKSTISSKNFKLLGAIIHDITPMTGRQDDIITIFGEHFDEIPENNKIYFDDLAATVVSSSKNSLKIKVPKFYDGFANVSIQVGGKKFIYSKPFKVINQWSPIKNLSVGIADGTSFSIDNKAYIISGKVSILEPPFQNGIVNSIWEYNSEINSWKHINQFEGTRRLSAVGFSINNKGYFGTGSCENGNACYNDFWEFTPGFNQWKQIKDVPGGPRAGAIGFSINGKGYIGYGIVNKADLWEYNPTDDSWKEVPAIGQSFGKPYVFVIDDRAYIGINNDLWMFNPVDYSWTKKANHPHEIHPYNAVAFSINGKGYVGAVYPFTGDFWEYNPLADKWTTAPSHYKLKIINAVGFVINNTGFVGSGIGLNEVGKNIYLSDFWKFEPEK